MLALQRFPISAPLSADATAPRPAISASILCDVGLLIPDKVYHMLSHLTGEKRFGIIKIRYSFSILHLTYSKALNFKKCGIIKENAGQ